MQTYKHLDTVFGVVWTLKMGDEPSQMAFFCWGRVNDDFCAVASTKPSDMCVPKASQPEAICPNLDFRVESDIVRSLQDGYFSKYVLLYFDMIQI